MNILMASSESLPFSKTGGLADVIFSLSKEFVKLKNNVSIVLPKYKTNKVIKGVKLNKIFQFDVKMNWRIIPTSVYHCYYLGIDFYFIENQKYFERENLYGYYDDGERFAYFTNAVVKLIASLPYKIDIVQALKESGYNSNRIRKEKLMGMATLQKLRHKELVSWATIDTLCSLLDCQPGDILEHRKDEE